jgi:peptidyl-prolyl cis-trans isomerase C
MPRAVASHILVSSEAQAQDLKQQIADGADFGDLAKQHSSCPSGQSGGSLGQFGRGDMVPEFDAVIFGDLPLGQTSDPVKTQFGYHLIQVQQRMG